MLMKFSFNQEAIKVNVFLYIKMITNMCVCFNNRYCLKNEVR